MLEKLRKRKDEKHKPEKLSNRETTKLMDKRAKLTLIMCNLRSKTGDFTKVYSQKFCYFKKYTYLCGDSSHHAFQTCTANQGGTFAFYNYNYHTHFVL